MQRDRFLGDARGVATGRAIPPVRSPKLVLPPKLFG